MTSSIFFFNDTATTEIYTLSLHDALPILQPDGAGGPGDGRRRRRDRPGHRPAPGRGRRRRSEEHTSELQSRLHLVCRPLLAKKKTTGCGPLVAVPQAEQPDSSQDQILCSM